MQVLLAFLLIVGVSAVLTTDRDQPQRRWPLLALCFMVAALYFVSVRLT